MRSSRALRHIVPLALALALGALALGAAPALAANCGNSSTAPGQTPPASGQLCGVDFSATVSTTFSGTVGTYTVSGASTIDSVTINWGDGSSSPGTIVGPASDGSGTITGSHAYGTTGTFTTTLTSAGTYNGSAAPPINGNGTATIVPPDTDADGRADPQDNCPSIVNPDQANRDGDALGDVCDPDNDNDGKPDSADACPTLAGATADGCPDVTPAVTARRTQSIARTAFLKVGSSCSGACARLKATGVVKYGGKTIRLRAATAAARAGTITLKLKIPAAKIRALRAALRAGARAKATITVVATSPSGRKIGTKALRVTVKR